MIARRFAVIVALGGMAVFAGWVAVGLAGLASPGIGNTGRQVVSSRAQYTIANAEAAPMPVDGPQGTAMGDVSGADVAIEGVALPDPRPILPLETPPAQIEALNTPDLVQHDLNKTVSPPKAADECLVTDSCIDQYLWSVYQRTPKLDTIRVQEQKKEKVKRKGKTRTVVKTVTKLVDEDFTWKDPKAAQKAGMPLMEYVIGGMDRSFKMRLYRALRALDEAGLSPGITSGFRDDYRQSLASGLKATNDRSYHGGSRRGGYGHGLAADVVSVKGETRSARWRSSEELWQWIDTHGTDYGIGRPYLDRDPPHVGPIDGREYADHRGRAKAQLAGSTKHNPELNEGAFW